MNLSIIIPLLNNLFRFSVILPELFWRIILFLFENPVEIGKVVKATLESYLSNGVGGVNQHPDRISYADIEDVIHHRFTGTKLEEPAERYIRHPDQGGKVFHADRLLEMCVDVFVNF